MLCGKQVLKMPPKPNYMPYPRCALALVLIFLLHTSSPAQYFPPPAVVLDKNDPELRAILTEIEADAEAARVKAKIPGISIVIVYDQDPCVHSITYSLISKQAPPSADVRYINRPPCNLAMWLADGSPNPGRSPFADRTRP